MQTLLVIDDESLVRYSFQRVFSSAQLTVLAARTAAEGLEMLQAHKPDVVVVDLQLPDGSGLELFRDIRARDQKRPVIFITAHGTGDTALEAMKAGAFDYLIKPIELERFSVILERALQAARSMNVPALLPSEDQADRIVGRSSVIQEMCKSIGRIAPQDVNVLILGESGTGKELVARALYQHSRRAEQPFLPVNCAAIPENLLESELFGHEQGAFTGAQRRRIGKFEQCHQGTLFLDEIGDLTPAVQSKLLRVLQEQAFERLGGNETVRTQVRVLAATNQNLEKLVQDGRFRMDLYYRLRGVTVHVPPLRERRDDIPELAHYFLFQFGRELDYDLRSIQPEVLEIFQKHDWPGNVRELQGVVRAAMLHNSGHVLVVDSLPAELRSPATVPDDKSSVAFDLNKMIETLLAQHATNIYDAVLEAVERQLLTRVFQHTRSNQLQASELLGLHRTTLRNKLRTLNLAVDKVLVDNPEETPS